MEWTETTKVKDQEKRFSIQFKIAFERSQKRFFEGGAADDEKKIKKGARKTRLVCLISEF